MQDCLKLFGSHKSINAASTTPSLVAVEVALLAAGQFRLVMVRSGHY
jgi:hypothetical protein